MTLPRATRSLCPICLRLLDANYIQGAVAGEVLLCKTCPEHGDFSVPVWQKTAPTFQQWSRPKSPSFPSRPATDALRGCPYDCGLCPEHAQHTCTGLLEITQRCNMRCPVCYAAAEENRGDDPSLTDVQQRLQALYAASGPCNVQFSGGEPTLRDDLPQLAAFARQQGFGLVQVNSNGLRLAREPHYARLLKASGVDSIYLQWDGVSDTTFQALRGRPCLQEKHAALHACTEAGLGVVLVATLVQGINDGEMGALLRLAVQAGGTVRGLHVQPAAFFGRFPWALRQAPRCTLPEVMHLFAAQAPEWIRTEHFHPPGCEHELCSCSALYQRESTDLRWLASEKQDCCTALPLSASLPPQAAADGARKSRQFVAAHWAAPATQNALTSPALAEHSPADGFNLFVARARVEQRFTLSAMAFQDALSLDIARVRGCCIHVVEKGGRLIPFCLYNLTSEAGIPLYRGQA